jgi:hypothetical protein
LNFRLFILFLLYIALEASIGTIPDFSFTSTYSNPANKTVSVKLHENVDELKFTTAFPTRSDKPLFDEDDEQDDSVETQKNCVTQKISLRHFASVFRIENKYYLAHFARSIKGLLPGINILFQSFLI